MPPADPTAVKRMAAALALMDQAMKKFGDAFNAADCNQQEAADYMEAEGRQLLRTAYRNAPELVGWLPDMHAALDDPNITFVYRSDDEAVRQAHERLAAESGGIAPA